MFKEKIFLSRTVVILKVQESNIEITWSTVVLIIWTVHHWVIVSRFKLKVFTSFSDGEDSTKQKNKFFYIRHFSLLLRPSPNGLPILSSTINKNQVFVLVRTPYLSITRMDRGAF